MGSWGDWGGDWSDWSGDWSDWGSDWASDGDSDYTAMSLIPFSHLQFPSFDWLPQLSYDWFVQGAKKIAEGISWLGEQISSGIETTPSIIFGSDIPSFDVKTTIEPIAETVTKILTAPIISGITLGIIYAEKSKEYKTAIEKGDITTAKRLETEITQLQEQLKPAITIENIPVIGKPIGSAIETGYEWVEKTITPVKLGELPVGEFVGGVIKSVISLPELPVMVANLALKPRSVTGGMTVQAIMRPAEFAGTIAGGILLGKLSKPIFKPITESIVDISARVTAVKPTRMTVYVGEEVVYSGKPKPSIPTIEIKEIKPVYIELEQAGIRVSRPTITKVALEEGFETDITGQIEAAFKVKKPVITYKIVPKTFEKITTILEYRKRLTGKTEGLVISRQTGEGLKVDIIYKPRKEINKFKAEKLTSLRFKVEKEYEVPTVDWGISVEKPAEIRTLTKPLYEISDIAKPLKAEEIAKEQITEQISETKIEKGVYLIQLPEISFGRGVKVIEIPIPIIYPPIAHPPQFHPISVEPFSILKTQPEPITPKPTTQTSIKQIEQNKPIETEIEITSLAELTNLKEKPIEVPRITPILQPTQVPRITPITPTIETPTVVLPVPSVVTPTQIFSIPKPQPTPVATFTSLILPQPPFELQPILPLQGPTEIERRKKEKKKGKKVWVGLYAGFNLLNLFELMTGKKGAHLMIPKIAKPFWLKTLTSAGLVNVPVAQSILDNLSNKINIGKRWKV